MEKKEFKVGEVFDAGLVRLKCMEPTAPNAGCEGCILYMRGSGCDCRSV